MKELTKVIIVAVIALCFLPSCNDWLSVTSPTEITAKEQFKTVSGFKDALIGVYLGMAQKKLYGMDMTWRFVDILSQQYADLPQSADYHRVQQYSYEDKGVKNKINSIWSNMYNVIANINLALDHIDKKKKLLGTINYHIIKGELLGLRAYLEFDLMRLFGYGNLANRPKLSGKLAVPYVRNYTKVPVKQRPYPKTFDLLMNDINNALKLLKMDPIYKNPQRPADFYEKVDANGFYSNRQARMNYYAVKALKARVLLWQGGTKNLRKAIDAAEEVINDGPFHLIDPSTYPAKLHPHFHPELIFYLEVDNIKDLINRLLRPGKDVNPDALGMTESMAHKVFQTNKAKIGVVDIRYNKLLRHWSSGAFNSGFVSIKLHQGDTQLNRGAVVPLIKLPEMYYIASEAYAKTGRLQMAIARLDTVRAHRGIVKKIPATADKKKVLKEITREYRKEYIMDGQLFFYYKRIGLNHIPFYPKKVGVDIYQLPYPESQTSF